MKAFKVSIQGRTHHSESGRSDKDANVVQLQGAE